MDDLIMFRPKPKQSTDLIELGHRLIALYDSDRVWAGEQTEPEYKYIAPPDDCA